MRVFSFPYEGVPDGGGLLARPGGWGTPTHGWLDFFCNRQVQVAILDMTKGWRSNFMVIFTGTQADDHSATAATMACRPKAGTTPLTVSRAPTSLEAARGMIRTR